MPIPLNTPIMGKIRNVIAERLEEAGRPRNIDKSVSDRYSKGKFYEFFKKHGLFDVDDSPYLTDEQRQIVPEIDRTYQSDLIDAIVDSLDWFLLGDFNDGVGPVVQNLIDKTLVKAMTSDTKINSVANAISIIPGLQPVKGANDTLGSMVSLAHGMNPYDLDVLPRFSFNLPSLSFNIPNLLPSGYIIPDWSFIKNQEISRNGFYTNGKDGVGMIIGTGIDMSTLRQDDISKIFVVNGIDSNGFPTGDAVTGISKSQYNVLKRIAIQENGDTIQGSDASALLNSDGELQRFRLNDLQILGSFVRYADATLWKPLSNPANWMHAHWGSITNNGCPSGVRTAVASYIYNHGPTLNPSPLPVYSAFISYCTQLGVLYSTGYEFPFYYTHLGNSSTDQIDSTLTTTIDGQSYRVLYGNTVGISGSTYVTNSQNPVIVDRIPRNPELANSYFTMAAYLISRRGYDSISDETVAKRLRKRRVDEANLIFNDMHGSDSIIKYQESINSQSDIQSEDYMRSIYFDVLIGGIIYRYSNIANPGTSDNGATNDNYPDYYFPSVEFEFQSSLKNIRFWNGVLLKDYIDS